MVHLLLGWCRDAEGRLCPRMSLSRQRVAGETCRKQPHHPALSSDHRHHFQGVLWSAESPVQANSLDLEFICCCADWICHGKDLPLPSARAAREESKREKHLAGGSRSCSLSPRHRPDTLGVQFRGHPEQGGCPCWDWAGQAACLQTPGRGREVGAEPVRLTARLVRATAGAGLTSGWSVPLQDAGKGPDGAQEHCLAVPRGDGAHPRHPVHAEGRVGGGGGCVSLVKKGMGSTGHQEVPEQCWRCLRTSLEEKPSCHGLWRWCAKGSGESCAGRCCWRPPAFCRNGVPAWASAGRARPEVGQADLLTPEMWEEKIRGQG